MEDNHKILKVEYLSNHLLDHNQILSLSLDDQTIFYKTFKCRRPPMEDNLQRKTTSNGRQTPMEDDLKWRRPLMEDDLQWKTTSNRRRPPIEDNLKI
jgi:hypothetical protein